MPAGHTVPAAGPGVEAEVASEGAADAAGRGRPLAFGFGAGALWSGFAVRSAGCPGWQPWDNPTMSNALPNFRGFCHEFVKVAVLR